MQAKLVVVGGRANKQEVSLRLPYTIGRSEESDLKVEHRSISRHHCELVERDGRIVLRDAGSANGTFIDRRQITRDEVLEPGDCFTIGPLTFRAVYELAAPSASAPSAAPISEEEPPNAAAAEPVDAVTMPPVDDLNFETDEAAAVDDVDLALPALDEESELDSFDLELSDEWQNPLQTASEQPSPAADPEPIASADEEAALPAEARLEHEEDSEELGLPFDLDESLEEASSEAQDMSAIEDDAPTEIGEFVDLRSEEEEAARASSDGMALAAEGEFSDDLLGLDNETVSPAETESSAEATDAVPVDEHDELPDELPLEDEVRDFTRETIVDDAPSQDIFELDEAVDVMDAEEPASLDRPAVVDEAVAAEESVVEDEPALGEESFAVDEPVAIEEPEAVDEPVARETGSNLDDAFSMKEEAAAAPEAPAAEEAPEPESFDTAASSEAAPVEAISLDDEPTPFEPIGEFDEQPLAPPAVEGEAEDDVLDAYSPAPSDESPADEDASLLVALPEPPPELPLEELSLDEPSEEIEFAEIDFNEESIGVEAPTKGTEEVAAAAQPSEGAAADSSDEIDFDDWVAAELGPPAPVAADEADLAKSADEAASSGESVEAGLPAADEADELSFDDVPAFDEAPSVDDETSIDDVVAFDVGTDEPEIAFDDVEPIEDVAPLEAESVGELPTAPKGPREKIELPAVFEEAAPIEFDDEPSEAAPVAEAAPPVEKPKRSWWPFGRARGKKEKPAKAPRASKGGKTKPAPVEPAEEIEFVLDDDEPLAVEDAAASGAEAEPVASESGTLPTFTPHDPLDDLDFPLDDGGQPIEPLGDQQTDFSAAAANVAETNDAIEFDDDEIKFDEPDAPSDTAAAVTDGTSDKADGLAAFSLDDADDEPAIQFDEAEPAVAFDDVEPAEEAQPTSDVVAFDEPIELADDAPVFEDAPPAAKEKPAKKSRVKEKPAKKEKAKKEKPAAGDKPRRSWWPFGGKKKSAEKPHAAWRGDKQGADNEASLDFGEATIGAGDDLRATLRPDDGPIVFDDAKADSAPDAIEFDDEMPTFDEPVASDRDAEHEEIVFDEAPSAVETAPTAAEDVPVFEMDDEEVPSFDLDDDAPEFHEDETAPSMQERRAGAAETGASSDGWENAGESRSEERPAKREPAAENEDDWDNFLKSFDQ